MNKLVFKIALAILISLPVVVSHEASAEELIRFEVLPFPAQTGDAVFDKEGNLHVVYANEGKVFYTVGSSNGSGFQPPQVVDPGGPKVTTGGERGPKMALGITGQLYVVWQSSDKIHYARSQNNGRSWTSVPVRDSGAREGGDMPAIAADKNGVVYILWVDYRDPKIPNDRVASHIYLDVSKNGGKSFGPDRKLTANLVRACPCCQPAVTVDETGALLIAYRTSQKNVKEIHLLRSDSEFGAIKDMQLSLDNWHFKGCPMSGPSLSFDVKAGRIVSAWTAQASMFSAVSRDQGVVFGKPQRLGRGRYHATVASPDGSQLLIWDEGRNEIGFRVFGAKPVSGRLPLTPGGKLLATPKGDFMLLKFR